MEDKCFEFGVVLSGAVSAGAYSAGSFDYLIEALDAWHLAKLADTAAPHHVVKLKALGGSSAGAMVSAIAASTLNDNLTPVTEAEKGDITPRNKRLYWSWVQQLDAAGLFSTSDLQEGKGVSAFNPKWLTAIADTVMDYPCDGKKRSYLSSTIDFVFCNTNLRGTPYRVTSADGQSRVVTKHADAIKFSMTYGKSRPTAGHVHIQAEYPHSKNWSMFKQSALASGAFPVGLAPRKITKPYSCYDHEKWSKLVSIEANGKGVYSAKYRLKIRQPAWDLIDGVNNTYLAVDGGVFNNDPIELVSELLNKSYKVKDAGVQKTVPGLILIDPFPGGTKKLKDPKTDTLSVLGSLYNAMLGESRFKACDKAMADESKVTNPFMITPENSNRPEQSALACSFIAAFSGFLSRRFRDHDYQLGRRNCQQFLRKHFVLPASDPLFASWTSAQKQQYGVIKNGALHLPVIPLVSGSTDSQQWNTELEVKCPELTPLKQAELAKFKSLLGTRLEKVGVSWLANNRSSGLLERFTNTGRDLKMLGNMLRLIVHGESISAAAWKAIFAKKLNAKLGQKIESALRDVDMLEMEVSSKAVGSLRNKNKQAPHHV